MTLGTTKWGATLLTLGMSVSLVVLGFWYTGLSKQQPLTYAAGSNMTDIPDSVINVNIPFEYGFTISGDDDDIDQKASCNDYFREAISSDRGLYHPANITVGGVVQDGCTLTVIPERDMRGRADIEITMEDNRGNKFGDRFTLETVVNQEPQGTDYGTTILEDTSLIIEPGMFGFSDPNNDPQNNFIGIIVYKHNNGDRWFLNGFPFSDGQFISISDIILGNLRFIPPANQYGSKYAHLDFMVQDDGGTANGGVDTDQSPNRIDISITAVDDLPEINNLQALWSLEGNGNDNSNHGYAASISGSVSFVSGRIGQTALLDGSSSYLSIPHYTGLTASLNNITISAWVKTTSVGAVEHIVTRDKSAAPNQRSWQFRKDADGKIRFLVFKNASVNGSITGATSIADGLRHHVVGSRDGQTIRLYVDGKEDTTGVVFTGSLNPSYNPIYVGRAELASPGYFNGSIDDVRLYNRALTTAEIETLYTTVSIPEDTTAWRKYQISDLDGGAVSCTSNIAINSSNTTLLPVANVTKSGSGTNCLLMMKPADNQYGTSVVTVSFTDSQGATVHDQLLLNVAPVDDAPVINQISAQTTPEDTSLNNISVTLTDVDNTVSCLDMIPTSSNTTLLPVNSMVITGTVPACTLSLTPAANAYGSGLIGLNACATGSQTPVLITKNYSNGNSANGSSISPKLAGEGRYMVFDSTSTDLVSGDTNGRQDIFLYDTFTQTMKNITLSLGANSNSRNTRLSNDGRYIIFESQASNLVTPDPNGSQRDIFLYDILLGTIKRVPLNGGSFNSSISADGSRIAIQSISGTHNIFLYNVLSGTLLQITNGNGISASPGISEDGQFIAFYSEASNLVAGDTNGRRDAFLYDVQQATLTKLTAGNGASTPQSISAHGEYVTIASAASNLTPGDTNGTVQDAFLYTRATQTLTNLTTGGNGAVSAATISADGKQIIINSAASNLTSGDTNGVADIFVYSLESGLIKNITQSLTTASSQGGSSSDGSKIVFMNNNLLYLYENQPSCKQQFPLQVTSVNDLPDINSLQGRWSFDASNARDDSNRGNTGAVNGGIVFGAGKHSLAAQFDGVNDEIILSNESNFDFTGSYTIHANILATGTDTYNSIVTKYDVVGGLSQGWDLILVNGSPSMCVRGGASGICMIGGPNLRDNNWHTVNAVVEANKVTVYIDGVFVGTQTGSITPLLNNVPVAIGSRGGGLLFKGSIDDVRIYNRALSSGEIADLHATVVTNEDTAKVWNYTVNDIDGVVSCTTGVNVTSSNATLLPVGNIAKSGTAPSCALTMSPAANQYGTSMVTVSFTDSDGALVKDQFIFTVNSVNDAPVGTDVAKTIDEDTTLTFGLGDFSVTDPNDTPNHVLSGVRISTLPTQGILQLSGVTVIGGQYISAANISSGLLKYIPAANGYGTAYATFTFQVQDNGGTTGGGLDLDQSPNTVTINVNPINDFPDINSLQGRWSFDASNAIDDSNHGSNGTLIDGPIFTSGVIRTGISLNNLNSYIQIPTNEKLDVDGETNMTFSMWANMPSGEMGYLISKPWDSAGKYNYRIRSLSNNTINFQIRANDTSSIEISAPRTPGVWQHIAGVIESNQMKLYINGSLVASTGYNLSGRISGNGLDVALGTLFPYGSGRGGNNGFTVNGKMDDVRIYNRALSSGEIADLYATVVTNEDTPKVWNYTVNDVDGAVNCTTNINVTSSNATLLPVGNIAKSGTAPSCALTMSPAANQYGTSMVTVSFTDSEGLIVKDQFILTVNSVNDAPTIEDITNKTIDEDSYAYFEFGVDDVETNYTALTITATSSNTGLVANENIEAYIYDCMYMYGCPGITHDLSITPNPNQYGTTTITVTVSDGVNSTQDSFVLTVNPVNDAPVTVNISASGTEDTTLPFSSSLFTNAYGDIENTPLQSIRFTVPFPSAAQGQFRIGATPVTQGQVITSGQLSSLVFVPAANWNGNFSTTWQAYDGLLRSNIRSLTVTIAPVNDAPTLNNLTVSTAEDVIYTFTSANFTGNYIDVEGNPLTHIRIESLPNAAEGVLKYSGANVTLNQVIPVANIGLLTFDPNANYNGGAIFNWNAQDGTLYASASATATILIGATEDPPVLITSGAITLAEDTTFAFSGGFFASLFTDVDGDLLQKIMITSLPANGALQLSGVAVTLNQEITSGTLASLQFVPYANRNGITNFTWKGSDGGLRSTNTSTIQATVTAVNDLPTLSNVSKSGSEDTTITFTQTDFTTRFSDVDNDSLNKIRIASLPTSGTLYLNSGAVTLNQEISATVLHQLTFVPNANRNGTTSFNWNASDGQAYATTGALVSITIGAVNDAPTISDIVNQYTNEDTPLTGVAFTIGDVDNTLTCANVIKATTNTTLLATGDIVIGGTGGNCTISMYAKPNQYGQTTITLTISDGTLSAQDSFLLDVSSVNDLPKINELKALWSFDANDARDDSGKGYTGTILGNTAFVSGIRSNAASFDGNGDQITFDAIPLAVNTTGKQWTLAYWYVQDVANKMTMGNGASAANIVYHSTTLRSILNNNRTVLINGFNPNSNLNSWHHVVLTFNGTALKSYIDGIEYAVTGTWPGPETSLMIRNIGHASASASQDWDGLLDDIRIYDKALSAGEVMHLYSTVTTTEDAPTTWDFTINDVEGGIACTNEKVAVVSSSNTTLLPVGNIAKSGTAPNCTLTMTPEANQYGTSTVTVSFTDSDGVTVYDKFTFTATPVNDAPEGMHGLVTVGEDMTYMFAGEDFGFSDPLDIPADTFTGVVINTLPEVGILAFNGTPVVTGQTISTASMSGLTFTPAANDNGSVYASFLFQVKDYSTHDGTSVLDPTPKVMTISVYPVNDAPTISDTTNKTTQEDIPLTGVAFTINDIDSILSCTTSVTFTTSNAAILPTGNVVITGNAPNCLMSLTPVLNQSGVSTVTLSVSDGLTGAQDSFDFIVNNVNDAPEGTDVERTIDEDTTMSFGVGNFGFSDPFDVPANAFSGVVITTLPSTGTLQLNGVNVTSGQYVPVSQVPLLRYIPVPDGYGSPYATFTFQVQDNGGTTGGGIDLDQSPNTFTIHVNPINDLPVVNRLQAWWTFNTGTLDNTVHGYDGISSTGNIVYSGGKIGNAAFFDPNSDSSIDIVDTPNYNTATFSTWFYYKSGGPAQQTLMREMWDVANRGFGYYGAAISPLKWRFSAYNILPYNQWSYLTTTWDGTNVRHYVNGIQVADYPTSTYSGPGTGYVRGISAIGTHPGRRLHGALDDLRIYDRALTSGEIYDLYETKIYEDTPRTLNYTIEDKETVLDCNANITITSTNETALPAANITKSGTAPNCIFTLTPVTGASGTGLLHITLQDSDGGITRDQISFNVLSVNDAPEGTDFVGTTDEDVALGLKISDFGFSDVNDSPSNAFSGVRITTLPTQGILQVGGVTVSGGQYISATQINDGVVRYVPAANGYGSPYATFTFQVQDDGGTVNSGINLDPTPNTATIHVNSINDLPVLTGLVDQFMDEDTVLSGVVMDITDVDHTISCTGDTVITSSNASLILVTGITTYGTAPSCQLSFAPLLNQFGTSTIGITVTDGSGGVATGSFILTVKSVNDAPVAVADTGSVVESGSVLLNVLINDTDVENDPLSLSSVGIPSTGTVLIEGGQIRYFAPQNASGIATFVYTITDTSGAVATGPVTVSIICVDPDNDGYCASLDCDNTNPLINPETVWYKDLDDDDYSDGSTLVQCMQPNNYQLSGSLTSTSGDCNDTVSAINPGATEVCDGQDNDCDGLVDEKPDGSFCTFCERIDLNVNQPTCEALWSLYTGTNGSGWANNANWTTNPDVATWYGVTLTGSNTIKAVSMINLPYNQLQGSLPSLMSNLTGMQTLILNNNILTAVGSGIGQLGNLQVLNMNNNQLTSLPNNIGGMSGLHELYLNNNQIATLPATIGNLTALDIWHMENNGLTALPNTINTLTQLDILHLGNNLILNPPSQIGGMIDLDVLRLNNNNITNLPDAIGLLSQLDLLDLSHNYLTTLPNNVFQGLADLDELNIGYNDLLWINSNFSGLQTIQRLYLEENEIPELPDDFGSLSSLTHVNLSGNILTTLPNTLGGLSNLVSLNIRANQLTSLPPSFGSISSLDHLYIQNNQLTGGLDLIGQIAGLQTLYAYDNRFLGAIPDTFDDMATLTSLYLQNNYLDRTNTHHAITSHLNQTWWNRPDLTRNISNQGDITPPVFAATGTIPQFVLNIFSYDIAWVENSYALTTGNQGLKVVFSGNALCSQLGTPGLTTTTGALTATIGSVVPGTYAGCTIALRDHANNLSAAYPLSTFQLSTDLAGMCDHPELTIPKNECLVLVSLYTGTNGDDWTNKQGWFQTANIEDWFGVRTVAVTGDTLRHVDGIFLQKAGGIDEHGNTNTWVGNNLVGTLPPLIGDLTYLKDLNVANNQISGTLPASLTSLANLVNLYGNNNQISGILPTNIHGMSHLEIIDLKNNLFTGTIPSNIGQINSLRGVNLSANQLTGTIPSSLGDLSNLFYLSLANNNLQSAIPAELGNATALKYLYLQYNRLTGALPSTFVQLVNMNAPVGTPIGANELNISNNYLDRTNTFTAEIPASLLAWYNQIQTKNISNQGDITPPVISGTGTIPFDLTASGSATYQLTIQENSFAVNTQGQGMATVFGPTASTCAALSGSRVTIKSGSTSITLQPTQPGIYENCELQVRDRGTNLSNKIILPTFVYQTQNTSVCFDPNLTIPRTECLALLDLYTLAHGSGWTNNTNWFTSADVDTWFGINTVDGQDIDHVAEILLHRNDVTDGQDPTVPGSFGNNLTGTLTTNLASLPYLTTLRVDTNSLAGILPQNVTAISGLQVLTLNENLFTGALPSSRSALHELQVLGLRNNTLTGAIPNSRGALTNLTDLDLSHNDIGGGLPMEASLWPQITNLNLSDNMFSGTVPMQISTMQLLQELDLSHNAYNGSLPTNRSSLQDIVSLNLGHNAFTGTLPTSWGLLATMNSLNVEQNALTGAIPQSWSGLNQLEHVDLSNNTLNAPITVIGNWVHLLSLDIGFNQFRGALPSSLSGLAGMDEFLINNNNFDRDEHHDAIIPNDLISWMSHIQTTNIANQGDVTKPIITTTSTILSPVSTQINLSITVRENSYAVNLSGQGMSLITTGGTICNSLFISPNVVTTNSGQMNVTLLPTAGGLYTCSLAVQDHGGNRGYLELTPFIYDSECGDGEIDPGEQCDEGSYCNDGRVCTNNPSICPSECRPQLTDNCNASCEASRCGDGYVDPDGINPLATYDDETCDNGSYCNNGTDCTRDPTVCANGAFECKPRTLAGCSATCNLGTCGDGVRDTDGLDNVLGTSDDEACDDGNLQPGDGCSPSCTMEFCGDGYRDSNGPANNGVGAEECDLGKNNGVLGGLCSSTCTLPDDECVFCYETCDGGTGLHNIFLLIDVSGSMNTNNRLASAKSGAINFVNLVASNAVANPNFTTNIGLIKFSDTGSVVMTPTLNYTGLKTAINNLVAGGGTNFGDPLQDAVQYFANNPPAPGYSQSIILLSDGEPTIGGTAPYTDPGAWAIYQANEAKNRNIGLYTIAVDQTDAGLAYMSYMSSSTKLNQAWIGPGFNKTATQSSTYNGSNSYAAAKAVNAETMGTDFALTAEQYQPRWEINMNNQINVEQINVWNRTSNPEETANFWVHISQTPFTTNSLTGILADPNIHSVYITGQAGRPTTISGALLSGLAVQGQYVRVQLANDAVETLINPQSLSPKVWLDAKDVDGDGDTNDNPADYSSLTTWRDKSGNNNHPTLQNALYRDYQEEIGVYLDSAGGNPGILFNGSDVQTGTIIYVAKKPGGDTNGTILQAKDVPGDSFVSTDPNGASSNYSHNTNYKQTYCPTSSGQKLTMTFSRFRTQDSADNLRIYNGNTTGATLLKTLYGDQNNNLGSLTTTSTASNGCLTLWFITNNGGTLREGWQAVLTTPTVLTGNNYYIGAQGTNAQALRLGTSPNIAGNNATNTNTHMYTLTVGGGSYAFRDGGNMVSTGATSGIAGAIWGTNGLVGATSPSDHFISEILVFSRVLTASELQQIEGYLAVKRGISNQLPTSNPYYQIVGNTNLGLSEVEVIGCPINEPNCTDVYHYKDFGGVALNTLYGHVFGHIHCDCNPEKVCGICGDGVKDTSKGEQCDEGSYCDDRDGITGTECTGDPTICAAQGKGTCKPRYGNECTPTCQLYSCGDGLTQFADAACVTTNNFTGAVCDTTHDCPTGSYCAGIMGTGKTMTQICLSTTALATCGGNTESCDDGNSLPGDGCSETCQLEGCGDGVIDFDGPNDVFGDADDEECDDNNTSSGDGCSAICRIENRCGDGVTDTNGINNISGDYDDETCDEGSYCDVGATVPCASSAACVALGYAPNSCQPRYKNGCTQNCNYGVCGDKLVDEDGEDNLPGNTDDELCDAGSFCPNGVPCSHNNSLCPGQCLPKWTIDCTEECKVPHCGDGHVDWDGQDNDLDTLEDNEECDDGNLFPGDNCSPTCQIEIDPQVCPSGFDCPDGYTSQRNEELQSYYCVIIEYTGATINGVCAPYFGGCVAGSSTNLNNTVCGGDPDTWTCEGVNGGTNASCSVADPCTSPPPVNGECGSYFDSCKSGTSIFANDTACGGDPDTWTCQGTNGGQNASCSIADPCSGPPPINGVCGNAFKACTSGVMTGANDTACGGAPDTWICQGMNGGANASCTINDPCTSCEGTCSLDSGLSCDTNSDCAGTCTVGEVGSACATNTQCNDTYYTCAGNTGFYCGDFSTTSNYYCALSENFRCSTAVCAGGSASDAINCNAKIKLETMNFSVPSDVTCIPGMVATNGTCNAVQSVIDQGCFGGKDGMCNHLNASGNVVACDTSAECAGVATGGYSNYCITGNFRMYPIGAASHYDYGSCNNRVDVSGVCDDYNGTCTMECN